MTAVKKPRFVTIEKYLAGEETGVVKHEYLGGTVRTVAGASLSLTELYDRVVLAD